jgi:hypothetical protein
VLPGENLQRETAVEQSPFNEQLYNSIPENTFVAIVKKRLHLDITLYTILQILSVTVFEQVPIILVLANFDYKLLDSELDNQCLLFDL